MRIPKGILKIATLSPTDGERFAFNSVNLQRLAKKNRCRAEVCDGRSAIRCDFDEPESEILPGFGVKEEVVKGFSVLVNRDDALNADATIGKERYLIIDEVIDGGILRMIAPEDTQVMFEGRPVEGAFPPIDSIIREYDPICTTAEAIGNAKAPSVRFGVSIPRLIQTLKSMQAAAVCDDVIIDAPLEPGRPLRIVPIGSERAVEMTVLLMPVALNDRVSEALPYGRAIDVAHAARIPQEVQLPLQPVEQVAAPAPEVGDVEPAEPEPVEADDRQSVDAFLAGGETAAKPPAESKPGPDVTARVEVLDDQSHNEILCDALALATAPDTAGKFSHRYAIRGLKKGAKQSYWSEAFDTPEAATEAGIVEVLAELAKFEAERTPADHERILRLHAEIDKCRAKIAAKTKQPAPPALIAAPGPRKPVRHRVLNESDAGQVAASAT